jgi:phosphatidylinositol glycan class M
MIDIRICGSPYARATYRYTPLLALVMSPIWLLKDPFGAFFGKIVFSFVSSFIVAPLLMQSPINASPTMVHLIWTLNPMILNINTRGSSESLLIAMVLGSLVMLKRRRLGWAAVLWALSVHWKVYPIVYGASILVELQKIDTGRLITRTEMKFALVSAGTFLALSSLCWAM